MPNLTESQLALVAEIKKQEEEVKRYVLEIMALPLPSALTVLTKLICNLMLDIVWEMPNPDSESRVLKVMEGELLLRKSISKLLLVSTMERVAQDSEI